METIKFTSEVVIENLFKNGSYASEIIPHLKSEYFSDVPSEKIIFDAYQTYFFKYNKIPSFDEIGTEIVDNQKLQPAFSEDIVTEACEKLEKLNKSKAAYHPEWLKNSTEEFCKHQALFSAIKNSLQTVQDVKKGKKVNLGQIESDVRSALSISFDNRVGHDYFSDYTERWSVYNTKENKIPFRLSCLNEMTHGGVPKKSLVVFLAGPNAGKSALLCDSSAAYIMNGRNVLYITLEMSEEEVAKRIDANLLSHDINKLDELSFEDYKRKIEGIRKGKNIGKLFIKKYPTASANVNHFRSLVNEYEVKKGVIFDVVVVDYMGIAASSRLSMSAAGGSYGYVKAISEEMRGFADEKNFLLLTGAQVNRKGATSNDLEMDDVAESFGINATSDLIIGISSNEEQEKNNIKLFKVLKSRFGSKKGNRRFEVGFKEEYMRFYDLDENRYNDADDEEQSVQQTTINFKMNRMRR